MTSNPSSLHNQSIQQSPIVAPQPSAIATPNGHIPSFLTNSFTSTYQSQSSSTGNMAPIGALATSTFRPPPHLQQPRINPALAVGGPLFSPERTSNSLHSRSEVSHHRQLSFTENGSTPERLPRVGSNCSLATKRSKTVMNEELPTADFEPTSEASGAEANEKTSSLRFNVRCLYRPPPRVRHQQAHDSPSVSVQPTITTSATEDTLCHMLSFESPSGSAPSSHTPATRCCHSAVAYDERYLIISFGGNSEKNHNDSFVFDTQPPEGVRDVQLHAKTANGHLNASLRRVSCPLHQFEGNEGPLALPLIDGEASSPLPSGQHQQLLEGLDSLHPGATSESDEDITVIRAENIADSHCASPEKVHIIPIACGSLRWTRIDGIDTAGKPIAERLSHTAALRKCNGGTHTELVVFGGQSDNGPTNDLLKINATAMVEYHKARVACAVAGHIRMARDEFGIPIPPRPANLTSLFCCDCCSPNFQMPPRWETVYPEAALESEEAASQYIMPRPRSLHSGVMFSLFNQHSSPRRSDFLFVLDGWGMQRAVYNDLWAFDFDQLKWRIIPFVGVHQGQRYTRDSWVKYQEQLRLRGSSVHNHAALQLLNPPGCPRTGLFGHSAAVHDRSMYVFGGSTVNAVKYSNDLHKFDFHTFLWSEVIVSNSIPRPIPLPQPAPRYACQLACVGDYLYLHGGDSEGCAVYFQDLWRVRVGIRGKCSPDVFTSGLGEALVWERLDSAMSFSSSGEGFVSKSGSRFQLGSSSAARSSGPSTPFFNPSHGGPFDLAGSSCDRDADSPSSTSTASAARFLFTRSNLLPSARSGHTVTPMGGALVIMGGEQPLLGLHLSEIGDSGSVAVLAEVHSISLGFPASLTLRQLAARWLSLSTLHLPNPIAAWMPINEQIRRLPVTPLDLRPESSALQPFHQPLDSSQRLASTNGRTLQRLIAVGAQQQRSKTANVPLRDDSDETDNAVSAEEALPHSVSPAVGALLRYELVGCTCEHN